MRIRDVSNLMSSSGDSALMYTSTYELRPLIILRAVSRTCQRTCYDNVAHVRFSFATKVRQLGMAHGGLQHMQDVAGTK
jgi:hypothetical protein